MARRTKAAAAAKAASRTEGMRDELRVKLGEIEQIISDSRSFTLRSYYQLGKVVLEVRENPDVYGPDAWDQLCKALPGYRRTMQNAAIFRKNFTEAEFDELLQMRDEESGFAIQWSHVVLVLGIEDKKLRKQLLQQALKKKLDARDFHETVKAAMGGARRAGGRPVTMPDSLRGQVSQVYRVTRQWVQKGKLWLGLEGDGPSVFDNILQLDEPPDDETFDRLLELETLLEDMSHQLSAMKAAMRKAMKHADKLWREQQQKKQQGKEYAKI